MKQKSKKSFLKRFKVTSTGKMLHRPIAQNHFNAKEGGAKTRNKRKKKEFIIRNKKLKKLGLNK
jgi:ribosomal protein L35